MAKFFYVSYMDNCNPVCEDVGKITGIKRGYIGGYGVVGSIIADGVEFYCDTKLTILLNSFFANFKPMYDRNYDEVVWKELPKVDGKEVPMNANVRYHSYIPITTDPRVLCILLRAHAQGYTLDNVESMEIPTREQAIDYLMSIGAYGFCTPLGWAGRKKDFRMSI